MLAFLPRVSPVDILSSYLPHDRRAALARGETIPDRMNGATLFADISGFTPLTERLTDILGARRGIEVLSQHLNAVYDTLITEVEQCGGSVVSFAGDAIICWFAGDKGVFHATACAFAMHQGMKTFRTLALPNGATAEVAVKISIACGNVRRFVVGSPEIQLHDILAGAIVDRMAAGEKLANKGETVLDGNSAESLREYLRMVEWRTDPKSGRRFAVVHPTRSFGTLESTGSRGDETSNALLPEQLRPWLLPEIYTRLQSGQGEFLTELRPGVPVFVKFLGIDFEANEAGAQLDQFIHRVQEVVMRYAGALIDITTGDKGSYFQASFGALAVHEDDPERAVHAAQEFLEIAAELHFLHPLQIGIGRGTLRTGTYGGSTRRVYGALGDDVNLASRLMEAARPGEILVSSRVQKKLGMGFKTEPRPPLHVKGKVEPVPVFVVKRYQPGTIRLQEPHYELPLVGRELEIAQLTDKMNLAQTGKGQIVGIVAEAGMGKSRLVAETIRLSREKGFRGYGGACQSGGISIPYLAWRTIWQAFFEVDMDQSLATQQVHLENKLKEIAPDRVNALPLLGPALGLALPENSFSQTLDPQSRKTALEALLVDCLKGIKEPGVLIVLEDLHWMDPLSRDLLEEIARGCNHLPVLIVLAYRPLEANYQRPLELEKDVAFAQIALNELPPSEIETLIHTRLFYLFPQIENTRGSATLRQFVAQISKRAQGNPFYAEELLNYLHDQNLDPSNPETLENLELPNSLHQLILSRIDQLTDREKTTLKVASVIGRLFPVVWLHGYYPALGSLEQIKSDLRELQHLDLTPLNTPEPDLTYLFKHIVTQEVTYESLTYEMRARLHEHLAQYLEKTLVSTRLDLVDLLAFHYGRSHNAAKQREYYRKAGETAQASFANETALDYYTRLLALLPGEEQIEILLKQGAVYELMGHWDEALDNYTNALTLAERYRFREHITKCQHAIGVIYRWRGDYDQALAWLEKARKGWETLGETSENIQTLVQIGIIAWREGNFVQARKQLEESLALARETDDLRGMAFAINNLGNVAWRQGDHAAAKTYHEENLELRRQLGGKRGISVALNNVGAIAHEQGEYLKATQLYRESLALAREMGDKQGISLCLDNLGMVALEQGEHTLARSLLQESLVLAWELGDKPGILSCLSNLGLIAQERGDFVEARLLNEQGLTLAREINDKFNTRLILQNLGYIALQHTDYLAAGNMYRESLALSVAMDDKRGLAHSLLGLSSIAARHTRSDVSATRAGHLLAAAEKLKNEIHQVWETAQRRMIEETQTEIQTMLGETRYSEIWNEGTQMLLEDAIRLAQTPL